MVRVASPSSVFCDLNAWNSLFSAVNPWKDTSSYAPSFCIGSAQQGQLCTSGLGAEPSRELIAE